MIAGMEGGNEGVRDGGFRASRCDSHRYPKPDSRENGNEGLLHK